MTWFLERNSSLLWNFNFKFHMYIFCGYEQKPIYFTACFNEVETGVHWFPLVRLRTALCLLLYIQPYFPDPFHIYTSYQATSDDVFFQNSKVWNFGKFLKLKFPQPYWIFLLPDSKFILALNIKSKLHFQNGRLVAILDFWVFRLCRWHSFRGGGGGGVIQVRFGISISNFICTLFVAVGQRLLIFSTVTLKCPPGGHIGFFSFQTLTSVWL